jgi:hypothetical protein
VQNLLEIITKPDNVAIVIMMVAVVFFSGVAFNVAIRNDRIGRRDPQDKVEVYPYLVRVEFLVTLWVSIGLVVWSLVLDAPLEEIANPNLTPNPAKAPWYFLGLQELLVYFDPWIAGVVLPGLIIIGLIAIPYLDVNDKGNGYYTFTERKWAILTFCFGFHILWILLIVIGVFMRGPGWLWFWPWEEWDPHRVVADVNADLPQLFGVGSRSFAGFAIGGGVVGLYYFLTHFLPYRYLKRKESRALRKLGLGRYLAISFLFWTMLALPIKIVLRLLLHVKYVWVTPWFNI